MENSFNKGVENLKKYLYYGLLIFLGLFFLGIFIKASLYIGIIALLIFALYKAWQYSKVWYFKFKKSKEKKNYEKVISRMKDNVGNVTYMTAEVLKEDTLNQSTKSFTYVDVDYEEFKEKNK